MQELMTVIVTWLSIGFGMPAIHEHPNVERVPMATMLDVRRDRHAARQPEPVSGVTGSSADGDEGGHGVHAVYDDLDRTIYLPDTWTATSAAEVSILVHELVHHLQNAAGTTHACPQERERLAYEAQASWLALFGKSLAEEFDIDAMTLLVRTRCIH